ncbi:hypothetical protein PYW08_011158 [Mythimna loreyi]|uniref:Uncharacterized protein n=1 Tax=Mythimna loreyi TaxID=667449 RepID=A0ACC2Q4F6_9NEOP|nr:hypothetical protein PYW08_011158 [Mythimna loreyi]
MQQPMSQPEPIGGQQAVQQQMVLCPVRFVYETQVLVQPDQIQPNQTFFINPQNPPPWMQNRPAPNPVVYVQQLPNNMLQPVQPQMDQNQLYLQQNFTNFQLQQHMLAQNHQEMRPIQFTNIPNVPNMVQNVQQNIQTNDRSINQNPNTGQIQTNAQNMIQNQMTVARQVPNQPNQAVDVQRQVQFMNVRPQMSQQMNIARPVMSLNQLQNMQPMANMQNLQIQQPNTGQTFVQNIGQQRMPQNVNAVRPQIMPNNVMNVQNVNNNKPPPQEANKTMNNAGTSAPSVRNFAQNYNCRPIQPRRRFVDNNTNAPKMQQQNAQQPKMQPQNGQQNVPQQQHISVQTQQPIHQTVQQAFMNLDRPHSHQTITNLAASTGYLSNPHITRKRKSESPDEIQNKMAAPPGSQPVYKNLQQGIIITKICNEIGTNTSPVHKPKLNANVSNQSIQMNQNTQNMVIVENTEQNKPDVNQMKHTSTETRPMIAPAPSESDKLIRNTVFTQARGRLLQDKISDNVPQLVIENKPPESVQNPTENKTNIEAQTDKDTTMTEVPTDKVITVTIQSEKGATVTKAQAETIESRIIQILESIPKNKNTQTVNTKSMEFKKELKKELENTKPNYNTVSNENNISKTTENNVSKTNENNVSKSNENVVSKTNENIISKTNENVVSKTNENIISKTNENVVSKINETNISKTNENNVSKTNENNASKTITAKIKEEKVAQVQEASVEVKAEKVQTPEKPVIKQDILTHVVDGYVIQESNFAFPIRKPLIEKTLQSNPKAESESMDALKACMKEEMKNTGVDVQLLPFHYLLLHCEKKKEEEEEMEDSRKLNPFTDLQHTTVKSWTVEDLSNHLLKYDWNETVSVFQDHEIDGESLFLVSKTQLVSIGVTEENAEVICAFIRS